jgi:hypothetical protein
MNDSSYPKNNVLKRIILSVLLAYPISGMVASGFYLTEIAHSGELNSIEYFPILLCVGGILNTILLGFLPSETGYINMYPWIIPTGIIIFVFLSYRTSSHK